MEDTVKTTENVNKSVELTVTSGVVRRHVSTLQVYRPAEGASNIVFKVTKPVVLYKRTDDSDESVPTETTEVKVWLRDIKNAIDAGNIPFMSALISQGGYSKEVLSALAEADVDFIFTPYEEGDEYTDANGDIQKYEHHGVKTGIKFASIKRESLMVALTAIGIKNSMKNKL